MYSHSLWAIVFTRFVGLKISGFFWKGNDLPMVLAGADETLLIKAIVDASTQADRQAASHHVCCGRNQSGQLHSLWFPAFAWRLPLVANELTLFWHKWDLKTFPPHHSACWKMPRKGKESRAESLRVLGRHRIARATVRIRLCENYTMCFENTNGKEDVIYLSCARFLRKTGTGFCTKDLSIERRRGRREKRGKCTLLP